MGETLPQVWTRFRTEMEARNQRLLSEFKAAFQELDALVQQQTRLLEAESLDNLGEGGLAGLEQFVQGTGQRLLLSPLEAFRRARPQERALAALDTHRTAMEDLVRRLPHAMLISGNELARAPEIASGGALHRLPLRWQWSERAYPLRAVVRLHLRREALERAPGDGRYFLNLARLSLSLLLPWREIQKEALKGFADLPVEWRLLAKNQPRWIRAASRMRQSGAASMDHLERWWSRAARRADIAILHGEYETKESSEQALEQRWQRDIRYWSRQQRAVAAQIGLERELARLALDGVEVARLGAESLQEEHRQLAAELEEVIRWLTAMQEGEAEGQFPPAQVRLVSAEDRATEWVRNIEAASRRRLPASIETVEPRRALPGRRAPWRQVEPEKALLGTLRQVGWRVVAAGFEEAEVAHRSMVREIERAREVVAYSMEAGEEVAREGVANALSLMQYQRDSYASVGPVVEKNLVEGTARSLLTCHLALTQRRLGFLTYIAHQSGKEAVREARGLAAAWIRTLGRHLGRLFARAYHWGLQHIGWEPPQTTAGEPVRTRGYLGDALNLRACAVDLPMIYRRLFRLAPVEDPRFLVGREAEMNALAEAKALWEAGRTVSAVVIGARGSGKTSLLNCAETRLFSGSRVVRGQFSERISTSDQMRRFLDELSPDLDGHVVMLEETERTFQRTMNGFEGLRELLRRISQTSPSTLWILSINQHSFSYLDRAVGFGQHFSHRLNAMAVEPEHLKNAVLLRHNLSGLRLQYAPPPQSDPRVGRLRKMLGLHKSEEELFFEALYRQSEGIFRAAFELWQEFIERAEGGVLYLQQPFEADYEGMLRELRQDDVHTLQAILEHGSLREEEHAAIFRSSGERSRMQLERLTALEFLEPEPNGPGLRIRPEAGRVVRLALDRRNLL